MTSRNTRSRIWYVALSGSRRLPTENRNKKHPAVFPRPLPEFFIKLLSKEGDVVLDPFAGSGTTLAVAADLGRRAIGIELMDQYVENMEAEFGIQREPLIPSQAPANDTEHQDQRDDAQRIRLARLRALLALRWGKAAA